ncbi:hepatic and glial cell adhesion molecule-like [Cetorhinus maximus]
MCRGTLLARPDTFTNAFAGERVLFPIQRQGREDQYNVTFRSRFPQTFEILAWKSNNPEKLYIVYPLYQDRVGIQEDSVVLYDAQVHDTGQYEIQIEYNRTELKKHNENTFKMQVFIFHLFVVCEEALRLEPHTITNVTAGEQVLFPIQYQGTDKYELTFSLKFPRTFKILTWKSSNTKKLHIVQPLYQHRVTIYKDFVALNDVHVNDTGEYEIHIDYYGTELKNRDESTFRMKVFEPVSQPVIAILCKSESSPNIILNCSVSNGTNATIHWEKVSLSGVLNETNDGRLLVIDSVTEKNQYVYRCIAKNPVSNATSIDFTVSPNDWANPKGKRSHLVFLAPLGVVVLVPTILYLLCYTLNQQTEHEI